MKTGFVISGGGARGVSHLGVLKALTEHDIRPDIIAGTSSGAIAGALFSRGFSPEEILEIVVETNFIRHFRPSFGGNGLLRLNNLESFLRKYIPENTFEALQIPLVVTATDLEAGELVCYRQGELSLPVLASCCLPGIFEPMKFGGKLLVDGGILNNLPVEVIEDECDLIIGLHCNPFTLSRPIRSTREILARSYLLAVHNVNMERIRRCHLLFEAPTLRDYSIFDLHKARKMYLVGYEHAMQVLEKSPPPATLLQSNPS